MNSLFEAPRARAAAVPLLFPSWDAAARRADEDDSRGALVQSDAVATASTLAEARVQERLEQAREQARAEAEEAAASEHEVQLARSIEVERTAVAHLCTAFGRERERYFAEIEREVVRLALAIAGKVLARETSVDPLLLSGVARAALSRLASSEGAVLHVPARTEEHWRRELKMTGVRVQGNAAMEADDLRIESAEGVAELGVQAQLEEIERGFCDLLALRPAQAG